MIPFISLFLKVFLLHIMLFSSEAGTLLDMSQGKTILCFGDSLTHGMLVNGEDWHQVHPYALKLNELIRKKFKTEGKENATTVIEAGISGELASHMVHRLPAVMKKISEGTRPDISVVVILAGTNDLGSRHSAKQVLEDVLTLHEYAKKHKKNSDSTQTFTIALSMPQLRWSINQEDRIEVNRGLKDYVQNTNSSFFISLEEPFDQKQPENVKFWSTDMVHFSIEGYDKIGELVFDVLSTNQLT